MTLLRCLLAHNDGVNLINLQLELHIIDRINLNDYQWSLKFSRVRLITCGEKE